jgi:hypothetical protein
MWKLLLLLLSPRIDEEVEPAEVEQAEELVDEVEEETEERSEEETEAEEEPAPRVSRAQRDIISTRQRAQKAEEDLVKMRAELDEARRQPARQAEPTQDQRIWQQEEEVLRNPESTDWQRYAVQSSRQARQAEFNSRNALIKAEDLSDRSSFERMAVSKPKLFDLYKDRVEETLTKLRSEGRNAPREKLLAVLVGEDMLSGKLKTAATKPGSVKRAALPSARSDVTPSNGRMTEAEKREKRLENVRI